MKQCLLPCLLGLFLLFAAPSAIAKTAEQLRQVEQQLEEKKQQQAQLDAAAQNAARGLEELRGKLVQSTQTLQDKETEAETLEDRLDELTEQIAAKSKNAAAERGQLAQMVSALIEIASRPPATLFLQKGTAIDHLHRSQLLHAVLPRVQEDAESAARDLAALYDLQTQFTAQKKLVEASQVNLQAQKQDLDQLIAARQGFLQRTEQQKAELAQHLAALSDEAKDLRQLMEKVTPPQHAAGPVPKDTVALKWPVAGSVKKHFGESDRDGIVSEGLTLSAPSGAPVVAPRAGKVVFAGPFRGYGQIMILQHAGGYHSFLSGFGRIDAEMGQDVVAGEPLGVLPVKPGTHPELYFEWRRGDEPVDPGAGLEMKKL